MSKLGIRLLSIALLLGITITLLSGLIYHHKKLYTPSSDASHSTCAQVDGQDTQYTYGFPWKFTQTTNDICAGISHNFRIAGLTADVALWATVSYAVIRIGKPDAKP